VTPDMTLKDTDQLCLVSPASGLEPVPLSHSLLPIHSNWKCQT